MQDALTVSERSQARGSRGSLVPALTGTLVVLLSLYFGLRTAPWLASLGWEPPALRERDRAIGWRLAQYNPERDPAIGMPLPSLELSGPGGRSLSLVPRQGERTALLFVGAGAG
jgi:hypothetical protein